MRVRDELVELRGLRFHYRDWAPGAGDAPVLIALHGYSGHARTWDHFAKGMCDRYRVLALDQRGHGETDWAPKDAYGTLEMVEDLKAFVRAMGLKRFTLLGLSMGGIVSFAYAGLKPAELECLVVIDIAPEISTAGLKRLYAEVREDDVFHTREDAFQHARRCNSRPPPAHHRDRVDHSLMRLGDGRWTFRFDRALRDPSVSRNRLSPAEGWRRVGAIDVPTLLVRGEVSDILDRDIAEHMVGLLARGELAEVRGSGHSVPLDRPDEFLSLVRGFLAKQPGSAVSVGYGSP